MFKNLQIKTGRYRRYLSTYHKTINKFVIKLYKIFICIKLWRTQIGLYKNTSIPTKKPLSEKGSLRYCVVIIKGVILERQVAETLKGLLRYFRRTNKLYWLDFDV